MKNQFQVFGTFLFLASVSLFAMRASGADPSFDTCFSPTEQCDVKLSLFLRKAKKSLDVAIYAINLPGTTEALISTSKHLKVRVVVDRVQSKGKKSTVPELVAAGVQVRYGVQKGSGIMHNKFSIVDGAEVELGSFNYTEHAASVNHENQFYTDASIVVARYQAYFEELWSGGHAAP